MKSFKEFQESIKLDEQLNEWEFSKLDTAKLSNNPTIRKYVDKKAELRDVEHEKQDPKMAKGYAKHMIDTDKAAKKAGEHGIKKYTSDFDWKVRNGVKRGSLPESAEVELNEEKIPVQHAIDSVHKVLGNKSAVSFIGHLKPGAEKHTSWNNINNALTKQGVQPHHIAKIASHVKPAQFKEEVELEEVLTPEQGAGEYIRDFQKSNAPQFQNKSQSKRKQMAIAAYLSASRKDK